MRTQAKEGRQREREREGKKEDTTFWKIYRLNIYIYILSGMIYVVY